MVQEGDRGDEINPQVTLLKLGTKYGCLLVKLDFKSRSVHYSLRHFLLTKNIIFVGVHTKEELIKLKCNYGLVIRNVVDLAGMNNFEAYGREKYYLFSGASYHARPVCNLMSLVNDLSVIQRARRGSWPNIWQWVENWGQDGLTEKQIEFATIEAYLVFRIAVKILKKYE
ncbi:hypothetical protein QN277_024161 [Acacia crassicarpa]|uniref:3'-5' exonuclease domain-containing protein n=1 Tax=Acacia crassicarpa TaxID=499986 RepID=A0AAE1JG05_9FABA|nr:hypothetical protein QN277_024161 [Acacia crassicarpa]